MLGSVFRFASFCLLHFLFYFGRCLIAAVYLAESSVMSFDAILAVAVFVCGYPFVFGFVVLVCVFGSVF